MREEERERDKQWTEKNGVKRVENIGETRKKEEGHESERRGGEEGGEMEDRRTEVEKDREERQKEGVSRDRVTS